MERLINLAYGQNRILELIAGGASLRDSLTSLLRLHRARGARAPVFGAAP
jgi:hypothetical protein